MLRIVAYVALPKIFWLTYHAFAVWPANAWTRKKTTWQSSVLASHFNTESPFKWTTVFVFVREPPGPKKPYRNLSKISGRTQPTNYRSPRARSADPCMPGHTKKFTRNKFEFADLI